jgi:hypothetical protein
LQYVGDTRIQALVTYYVSGDSRLPANAIRQVNASRLPEGLTYSRYPSHLFQAIPGFSLIWVLMLDDYLLYTGDLELVRECAGGVYSVLRSFESYQTTEGFLANVPYWNYHDWTFPDSGTRRARKSIAPSPPCSTKARSTPARGCSRRSATRGGKPLSATFGIPQTSHQRPCLVGG